MSERDLVQNPTDRGLPALVDRRGRFPQYLSRRFSRTLLTAGCVFAALFLLPVMQPDRGDALISPGESGEARAAGSTLENEIFFATQRRRLGSWAFPAGTYAEQTTPTAHRVHIVYRVGVWDQEGSEVEFVFLYDKAAGAVTSDNTLGLSYLEGMEHDCARRMPEQPADQSH